MADDDVRLTLLADFRLAQGTADPQSAVAGAGAGARAHIACHERRLGGELHIVSMGGGGSERAGGGALRRKKSSNTACESAVPLHHEA